MRTNDLRERLASAFHSEARDLRYSSMDMDWASAYELADIALVVIGSRMSKTTSDEPAYDKKVDDCPECEAKPDEDCIMWRAIWYGFPEETPMCPREQ